MVGLGLTRQHGPNVWWTRASRRSWPDERRSAGLHCARSPSRNPGRRTNSSGHLWTRTYFPNREKAPSKRLPSFARPPTRIAALAQLATRIQQSSNGVSCIHVMDREADNYDLFATLQQAGARFVVRATHDRALATDKRLFSALEEVTPQCFRDVEVSDRRPRKRARETAKFPPRALRTARVAIAGVKVTLRRPNWSHSEASELTVNLVRIWEPSPPDGEPAVSWLLYTSEPIKRESSCSR